jgi:energy-coupling factor transport system ATP-binding protein
VIPLTVERLRYRWPNGSSALERCSFSIPGPGLWMLVGGNGSGKSTLLRLIAGLLKAESGDIISTARPALACGCWWAATAAAKAPCCG